MTRRLSNAQRPEAGGFTLIELLVVIGILALLMGILLPSLRGAREQAKGVICLTHQRAIHQALLYYAQENRDWLPGVDGPAVGCFWWEAVEQHLDKRIPQSVFDCRRENMPEVLFCPMGKDPFPKPYMLGKIEITHYFLNGVERGKAMGAGREVKLGLFGSAGRTTDPVSPSRCMMLGDSAHYSKIVDLDHPAAIQAFEKAEADIEFARIRYHHRSTAGFFHKGKINLTYADGHGEPMVGKSVDPDDAYANDPTQWPIPMRANPRLFYPRLRLPVAEDDPFFWGPPYDKYREPVEQGG
jgi:prepilin-type N-terminal cleavage/methylation domain-containing protein/prepilin-type processing-associated H-X9-DG protein